MTTARPFEGQGGSRRCAGRGTAGDRPKAPAWKATPARVIERLKRSVGREPQATAVSGLAYHTRRESTSLVGRHPSMNAACLAGLRPAPCRSVTAVPVARLRRESADAARDGFQGAWCTRRGTSSQRGALGGRSVLRTRPRQPRRKRPWRPRSSGSGRRWAGRSRPKPRQIRRPSTPGSEPQRSSGSSRPHRSRRRGFRRRHPISRRSRRDPPRCRNTLRSRGCVAGSDDSCMATSRSSDRKTRRCRNPVRAGRCLPQRHCQTVIGLTRRYRGNAVALPSGQRTTPGRTIPGCWLESACCKPRPSARGSGRRQRPSGGSSGTSCGTVLPQRTLGFD